MKQPMDGLMDERAPYVALSRATALEKLFMVEHITIDQLRHKPKEDIAATLHFLERNLDKATQAVFLDNPSAFTPVTVRSLANEYNRRNQRGCYSGDESHELEDGIGNGSSENAEGAGCNPPVPLMTFLAPSSHKNCFFNASIACTLAAYDGQPLLSEGSPTPLAQRFFSAVNAVRQNMHNGALPQGVLVSYICFSLPRTSRLQPRWD